MPPLLLPRRSRDRVMKPDGRDRKKPAEAGLIELCDVALALIYERGELLKLLRADAVSEERDDVFNATLKRLKDLGRISHQVQLAFRNSTGVEDGRGRIETVLGTKAKGSRSLCCSAV